jgi:hypothetical protein
MLMLLLGPAFTRTVTLTTEQYGLPPRMPYFGRSDQIPPDTNKSLFDSDRSDYDDQRPTGQG